jgi:branched-chain amino acid transport system ATP-binding protein
MADPLLRIEGLVKRFGGLVATDRLSLDLKRGELHALIGPNGAGKTTLVAQLMGEIAPDAGTILLDGRPIGRMSTARRVRLGLGRTFQVAQLLPQSTALDNIALALQTHGGHSFRFLADPRRDSKLRSRARELLERAELGPCADTQVSHLAHGEQKQLELAIALATQPQLLLLDEPLAGLGPAESQRMIAVLRALKGSVAMLLVEHDMDAVFALADRISVLVYGRVIASGRADEIQNNPDVRVAYLGDGDA